jgi:polyketide biosynthesis enoyl-CoA hydratase PksH
LIREIGAALDLAEQAADCRTVVLAGTPGLFCTGMDFQEAVTDPAIKSTQSEPISAYLRLLKRFTLSSKVIVCRLDGKVIAGGVGLVAASDIVISSERTELSLSEALWGLLPCSVIPFLIRRVGFQKAYFMTLTTKPISAREAHAIHLVDELTDHLDETLRRLTLRLNILDDRIIVDMKRYFQRMGGLTPEIELAATTEFARLAAQPHVQQNIANYVTKGVFPWERKD